MGHPKNPVGRNVIDVVEGRVEEVKPDNRLRT